MTDTSPVWQMPPGAQWIGHDVLVDLPLATPGHRAILDRFIAEDGSTPVLRAPWAQVGWFAEAAAWMEAQLGDHGYTLTKPVEQIKNWCLASLLRADTTRGDVYFLHEKDASVRARLRDAYLRLWADFEPMDRLLAMWSLAEPLCALHQAVSYRHITANVEPVASRELDWASPFWQRKVIEALLQGDIGRSG